MIQFDQTQLLDPRRRLANLYAITDKLRADRSEWDEQRGV